MKIAYVDQPGSSILPGIPDGSIAIWIDAVARRLASSSDVIIYTAKGRSTTKREIYQGLEYRRINSGLDKVFNRLSRHATRIYGIKRPYYSSPLYSLGFILQVAKDLKKERCDIVHIHNYSQFVPVIRAFNPGIKIVLHMHCEWLTQLDRNIIEHQLSKTDLIAGCSDYLTGKISNCFPRLANRCKTIYHGVDVDLFNSQNEARFEEADNTKHLLFVGRVSPEKGLHILIDALALLLEQNIDVMLDIIGKEKQLSIEYLIALSDDPKVTELSSFYGGSSLFSYYHYLQGRLRPEFANRVTFLGNLPYSQVTKNYQAADILVNPSFSEAFGRSLIEAMACQVPVVATQVGGMAEIVEGSQAGILVNAGDATVLSNAIQRILSDKELKEFMGQAGRQRVLQMFTWERVVDDMLQNYWAI